MGSMGLSLSFLIFSLHMNVVFIMGQFLFKVGVQKCHQREWLINSLMPKLIQFHKLGPEYPFGKGNLHVC